MNWFLIANESKGFWAALALDLLLQTERCNAFESAAKPLRRLLIPRVNFVVRIFHTQRGTSSLSQLLGIVFVVAGSEEEEEGIRGGSASMFSASRWPAGILGGNKVRKGRLLSSLCLSAETREVFQSR